MAGFRMFFAHCSAPGVCNQKVHVEGRRDAGTPPRRLACITCTRARFRFSGVPVFRSWPPANVLLRFPTSGPWCKQPPTSTTKFETCSLTMCPHSFAYVLRPQTLTHRPDFARSRAGRLIEFQRRGGRISERDLFLSFNLSICLSISLSRAPLVVRHPRELRMKGR